MLITSPGFRFFGRRSLPAELLGVSAAWLSWFAAPGYTVVARAWRRCPVKRHPRPGSAVLILLSSIAFALATLTAFCVRAATSDGTISAGPSFETATGRVLDADALADPPAGDAPQRSAFFGDLHIHTMYSYDAYRNGGERNTPDDAYRYAKGEPISHRTGSTVQLSGAPLDFLAVTDHAEWLGVDAAGVRSECKKARRGDTCQDAMRNAWQREIEAAERHNDPGSFTALIGFEYGPNRLHRNVIYKNTNVPPIPFSAWNSKHPRDLWIWMDAQRDQGRDALAIPHNSNHSDGRMFPRIADIAFAEQRIRNEPAVEINQSKGASEVHPRLSPDDRWADFQIGRSQASRGSYWRGALNTGLELEEQLGVNPYRVGAVGGSDSHATAGSYEEDAYFSNQRTSPQQRTRLDPVEGEEGVNRVWITNNGGQNGTGGLTGVWAEANTRAELFEAIRRRETFGTSGPRITVRLFGGFGLAQRLSEAHDDVEAGYAYGVPMGGVLRERPGVAPSFLVWAMRDPGAGRLQRLQIVKGWLQDGTAQEHVVDVACSDGLVPSRELRRCRDNGAAVNLADCSVSEDRGADELKTVWTDPDFEAAQHSYYYARVLENPSCRWTTWDAVRLGAQPDSRFSVTHQERAWSSPIWIDSLSGNTGLEPSTF